MATKQEGITIGTISGGIVNFGGAFIISPVTVTNSNSDSGSDNTGTDITTRTGLSSTTKRNITELLEMIKAML
ncbi:MULTISPECIES: spore germination protein [unclassified Bacillus (in: firmicutes)]|uniref:spore germination protein n=1 Tax=unclassified Bacillus (in: firmicutes) TaxID=185979 RepID=UPI001BE63F63|nr:MULTISPECIES: spore germination protein [unclassified Bacillus (in: firmicutes)]MBT2725108.1 spore germination protein [Bacillus sp. ISL-46]MBT2744411.1 spore germination protein [Bacillus sp. ISL-77]